ncbi:predicted protein [Uncinocarpus reesii 1704]|uniref:Uncharacterized protein n=1 Tax=Uncinocarpus reesii (strain UAMH 1704) TaxID=336963 RepID=C4JHH4_UNCRE|nr:uncharacterized protein UREG_01337 [Uncinocarpus reesii 1704]EEP76488.1 predicted protein [Uncinocarpus reesii 1704]
MDFQPPSSSASREKGFSLSQKLKIPTSEDVVRHVHPLRKIIAGGLSVKKNAVVQCNTQWFPMPSILPFSLYRLCLRKIANPNPSCPVRTRSHAQRGLPPF